GSQGRLDEDEGRNLRRQISPARRRKSGHRKPSGLVRGDRVYAAVSRREEGSPRGRLQEIDEVQNRRRRPLSRVSAGKRPLSGWGEAVSRFRASKTQRPRRPEGFSPPRLLHAMQALEPARLAGQVASPSATALELRARSCEPFSFRFGTAHVRSSG